MWPWARMNASRGGKKQIDGVGAVRRIRPPGQVTGLVLKVGEWMAGEEVGVFVLLGDTLVV